MESESNKERETERKKGKSENQEQYRIVVSKETSEALEKMLSKSITDFIAGEINKSDIANWIILNAVPTFNENDVKSIQKLHFDERKILGALLKDSKKENKIPEILRKAIRDFYGVSETPKRKSNNLQ